MRDSRTAPAAGGGLDPDREEDDRVRAEDRVPALGSEQLEAVVPRISASILQDPPPASGDAPAPDAAEPRATTLDADGGSTTIAPVGRPRADLVIVGAASMAVWFVTGDARVALACCLLVGASWVLRRMDPSIPLWFGQGFIGYRSDLGWPRGVQEEDDVHWDWGGRPPDVGRPDSRSRR